MCGAFLVTNDSSDRLEAHYQGKQHQGYLKIRDTIEQMRVSMMYMIETTVKLMILYRFSRMYGHPGVFGTLDSNWLFPRKLFSEKNLTFKSKKSMSQSWQRNILIENICCNVKHSFL